MASQGADSSKGRPRVAVALLLAAIALSLARSAGAGPPAYPAAEEQCGAACSLFLLRYYGIPTPVAVVTDELPADPTDGLEGSSLLEIKRLLWQQGLFAVGVQGISLADLVPLVDGKVTALVVLTCGLRTHFCVLLKGDGHRALVADAPRRIAWAKAHRSLSPQFDPDGGGGSCLLVSADSRALRASLTTFGLGVPEELRGDPCWSSDTAALRFSARDVRSGQVLLSVPFRNTGELPLVVRSVDVGCGCVSVVGVDRSVDPGSDGRVQVAVDCSAWGEGRRALLMRVATNDPVRPVLKIPIEGACAPQQSDERGTGCLVTWYPHEVSFGVLADVALWCPEEHPIILEWPEDADLALASVTCDVPGAAAQATGAEGAAGLRVTVDLASCEPGPVDGRVTIGFGGAASTAVSVPLRGRILPVVLAAPSQVLMVVGPSNVAETRLTLCAPAGGSLNLLESHVQAGGARVALECLPSGNDLVVTVRGELDPGLAGASGQVYLLVDRGGEAHPLVVPVSIVRLTHDSQP